MNTTIRKDSKIEWKSSSHSKTGLSDPNLGLSTLHPEFRPRVAWIRPLRPKISSSNPTWICPSPPEAKITPLFTQVIENHYRSQVMDVNVDMFSVMMNQDEMYQESDDDYDSWQQSVPPSQMQTINTNHSGKIHHKQVRQGVVYDGLAKRQTAVYGRGPSGSY